MRIAVVEDKFALAKRVAHRLRNRGNSANLLYAGIKADVFLWREIGLAAR